MADAASDPAYAVSPEDKILREAKKRFQRCVEWEADARTLFLEDLKFANADADNGYQWPNDLRLSRDREQRPRLTINKTRQHNLQIINDARQNKPSVKVRPVGNGATYEAAQVYDGIIRHIEYVSNAQAAYDTATRFQVQAGIGYWHVETDYSGADTFDQEAYIRRIKDPLAVYLDPDIMEVDGSDARYGFIFEDMPRDQFDREYPSMKGEGGQAALGNGDNWITKDYVRRASYYRKVEKSDRLAWLPDVGEFVRESTLRKLGKVYDALKADPRVKWRDIITGEIRKYTIVGDKIAAEALWPGKYIPIVRVIAEETVIEGKLDRKGHTRAMKDPQRMYNFWTSAAAEHVALQGKTPYKVPVGAIEGLETYWETANRVNHAVLPYNGYDDQNRPHAMPMREQPPQMAQAYIDGMKVAAEEVMSVSGQYQAELGMPSNERSGKAINERQRQGENATYHYIDHLAIAIRFTGKILIDLIPKLYDTPRILKIMGEDGEETDVLLDPKAAAAHVEAPAPGQAPQGAPGAPPQMFNQLSPEAQHALAERRKEVNAIDRIFNPNVGKYEVQADVGPAFATKRQEAFNALSQIAAQNPEMMKMVGDILWRAADFPMADELAERFKKILPPGISGEDPPPEVALLTQKVGAAQGVIQQLIEELAEAKKTAKSRDVETKVHEYDAITDRLKVLLPTILNPADIARMMHELMMQDRGVQLDMVANEHAAMLEPPTAEPTGAMQ